MEYKVGDKIKWSEAQRAVRGKEFTGGKEVETIVEIDPGSKEKGSTKLWMTNGRWINPECVVKVNSQ